MKKKVFNFFLFSSFVFFILFLFWITLFKNVSPLEIFTPNRFTYRRVSIIPFSDMLKGYYSNIDILGNIILFIPVGVYINLFIKKLKIYQKILLLPLISIFFELNQYIFSIGATDATDVVTNTIGGIIGMIFYWVLKKILKCDKKTQYIISTLSFLVMIFVSYVLFLLFK